MLTNVVKYATRHKQKVSEYYLGKCSKNAPLFKYRKLFKLLITLGVVTNDGYLFDREMLFRLIADGIKLRGKDSIVIKPRIRNPIISWDEVL